MNQTKLWIHIGMPKTGTTSLQELLAHNRDLLVRCGYLYPDFGHNQHYPLVRSFARESGSPAGFPPGGIDLSIAEIRRKISTEVQTHSINNVVLSSEFFFDYPGLTPHRSEFPIEQALPHLRGVASLLRDTFSNFDARVIVWLRRQDQWLMLMYNNVVKGGNFKHDFDTFYKLQVAPWYGSILDQWADIFGTKSVLIFIYDDSKDEVNIIPAFLEAIAFPLPTRLTEPPPHVRSNNFRLSRELLIIKREINRHMPPEIPGFRHQVEDLFFDLARAERSQGKEDSAIISQQRQQEIMEKFADENRRVVERFFGASRHSLFPDRSLNIQQCEDQPSITADTLLSVITPILMLQAKRIRALESRLEHALRTE